MFDDTDSSKNNSFDFERDDFVYENNKQDYRNHQKERKTKLQQKRKQQGWR